MEHLKKKQEMSLAEISSFCSQVAMMLNSGMPLYEGMEALAVTNRGSEFHDSYERVSRRVTETGSLYTALKDDGCWPKYLVEMTRIGEQAGQLDDVMRELSVYYARENSIRDAIVSAVSYPLVLGGMMLMIVFVMLFKVLPVFQRVLNNIGTGLTESGTRLVNVGGSICWVVLALAGVAMIAVIVCFILTKTGARADVLRLLKRIFPPFRKIDRKMNAARVASVLSMMLSSGFPIDSAMEMACSVIDDAQERAKLEAARDKINHGVSLGDAIMETGLFDEFSGCMIRMGITAGCVDSVMKSVAASYQEQVESSISELVSIVEPTLVAVLAVVVGAVLMSVMLPMAGIITSIM